MDGTQYHGPSRLSLVTAQSPDGRPASPGRAQRRGCRDTDHPAPLSPCRAGW